MKYQINLISSSSNRVKPVDRVIYFSLNYLRYILVFTQIVVIAVFMYKFRVDQKIIDLNESATEKQEIITVSQPLIKEARAADFTIRQSQTLIDQQDNFSKMDQYLFSNFPKDLFLTKFSYDGGTVSLDGYTQNIQILKGYYQNLKKEAKFKNIVLKEIVKSDLGFEFTFNLGGFTQ